jgi:nitrogen fixation NifU-like protein
LQEPFDAEVHHVNPTCGDEITLRVALRDVDGSSQIESISYDSQGCSISQAAASVMFDQLAGRSLAVGLETIDEFGKLMRSATQDEEVNEDLLGDAIAFVGVAKYPARIKCALLAWMAFKDAAARATADTIDVTEAGGSDD